MKHNANWLVLFLIQNVHEVQEDTKYLDEVLAQVLEFRQHPGTEIVLCVCTSVLSHTLKEAIEGWQPTAGPLFCYLLRLKPMGEEPRFGLLAVVDGEGTDLTSPVAVKHIFRRVQERFAYRHVALTTWDHGSGFAIFTEPDPVERPERTEKAGVVINHPDHFARVHALFKPGAVRQSAVAVGGGLLNKFRRQLEDLSWLTPPRGLTMDELEEAIRETFGSVEIILMRNCFMQIFDTGYTLRGVTKYLVATEGLMYFRAYDYDTWLDMIDRGGSLPEIALAAIWGFSHRPTNPEISTDTAIFANELSYYPALNDCMNRMTHILTGYAQNGGREMLRHCRSQLTDIVHRDFPGARFQLVDGRLWFETAGSLFPMGSAYQRSLAEFRELHDKAVGGRSCVGHLIGNGQYGASGFSLYFPGSVTHIAASRSYYELYYAMTSQYISKFTKDSYWDEFIGTLFGVV